MRFTARLGKRNMLRLPDQVIEKLDLKEGDIVVFDVNQEIKISKIKV